VAVAVIVAEAVGVTVIAGTAPGDAMGEPTAGALAGGNGVPTSCAWAGAGAISHQRKLSQPPSSLDGAA